MILEYESDDNSQNTPPKKKSKTVVKYHQKYNCQWELDTEFRSWLKRSSKDVNYGFCSACKVNISIKSGKLQLRRHANSEKHINICTSIKKQQTLSSLQSMNGDLCKLNTEVRDAEIRLAAFVTEHNLPFTIMDHLPQLLKTICNDSKVARSLASARTKTTQIVKNILGRESRDKLIQEIKRKQFSLIVDESTDRSCTKHLCIVVRFASDDLFKIKDCFLALVSIEEATADALLKHIVMIFNEAGIPYKKNMIGFAADGANTMMGTSHSLRTLFFAEITKLIVMKCICHSFHLCASYACLKLPRSVEDLARNIYNYFNNSPKWQGHLKQFQHFVDVKPHKLLHPAQTRWLSLKQVVNRLLEQYEALKLFFIDVVAHDRISAAENILNSMNDPVNRLFLEFLAYVLPIFTNLNTMMQSEEPQIHKLHSTVSMALKTIFDCYLDPKYWESTPLIKLNQKNPLNFLPIGKVYYGAKVAIILNNGTSLSQSAVEFFQLRCLDFYIESASQILKRFPLDDTLMQSLEILDPANVRNTQTIACIAARFPNVILPDNVQDLDSEWRMLRNADIDSNEKSVIQFWKSVSDVKYGNSLPMFPLISKLVFTLLSLPHSSANVERVSSTVNNMKTKTRINLSTKTIEGCLHAKRLIGNNTCYNFPIEEKLRNKLTNKYTIYDSNS